MSGVLDRSAELASPAPPPGADAEALLDAWRDACMDARIAYRAWNTASRYRSDEAYAVFTAADEREAAAADALARLVARGLR
jgi:hypothetical protein